MKDKGERIMEMRELVSENSRRRERELNEGWEGLREADYDPQRGVGSYGKRVAVGPAVWTDGVEWVPEALTRDMAYQGIRSHEAWQQLRCRYDFEYWAVTCAHIKSKTECRQIPFRLNVPQRYLLRVLEGQRQRGEPIRVILLKARQWGGSTLVQHYMAWLQCCVADDCNSLIVAQNQSIASSVQGMFSKLLEDYPAELWEWEGKPCLKPYQRSQTIRQIEGRHCTVTIGTAMRPDAMRGQDYQLAHLSEVAFWPQTPKMDPRDLMRSVVGSVAWEPLTLVVLESSANGVGNFFHDEWLRNAPGGTGRLHPVFVPWYRIAHCQTEALSGDEQWQLWQTLDDYERRELWEELQLPLERIAWWRKKRSEFQLLMGMQAENPSTPQEAFASTDTNVFDTAAVERLRQGCREALWRGDVSSMHGEVSGGASLIGVHFQVAANGAMQMWEMPQAQREYVVAIDIGGRWRGADWTVIAVLKVPRASEELPEVVAQWRGHEDTDIVVWRAAMIATYYGQGQLVFESNSLEGDERGGADPNGAYLLNELKPYYPNLYHRRGTEAGGGRPRPGFHTNRQTKQMIINELVAMVRDGAYVERDNEAVNELAVYERTASGAFGARSGKHDDILMTRAIGLHAIRSRSQSRMSAEEEAQWDRYNAQW